MAGALIFYYLLKVLLSIGLTKLVSRIVTKQTIKLTTAQSIYLLIESGLFVLLMYKYGLGVIIDYVIVSTIVITVFQIVVAKVSERERQSENTPESRDRVPDMVLLFSMIILVVLMHAYYVYVLFAGQRIFIYLDDTYTSIVGYILIIVIAELFIKTVMLIKLIMAKKQ